MKFGGGLRAVLPPRGRELELQEHYSVSVTHCVHRTRTTTLFNRPEKNHHETHKMRVRAKMLTEQLNRINATH